MRAVDFATGAEVKKLYDHFKRKLSLSLQYDQKLLLKLECCSERVFSRNVVI